MTSGQDKTNKTVAKEEEELIVGRFRQESGRKLKEVGKIKVVDYHLWGETFGLLEKSKSLKALTVSGLTAGTNYTSLFKTILTELEYGFTVEDIKTLKSDVKSVGYDVRCVPGWSFLGFGRNREEAQADAAKKGLKFLIDSTT